MALRYIVSIIGALEGLLLARLLLQLLAARPDQPAFAVISRLSGPLVAPFAFLDAGQPRFGAILEFSTLVLMLLLALLAGMLTWVAARSPARSDRDE